MKKERTILATWIMCPDGTMLPSFYGHDYRTHTTIDYVAREHPEGIPEPEYKSDNLEERMKWNEEAKTVIKQSRWSMVDGGPSDYGRRGGDFIEMSVYSDDPFEVIRRFVCRGGRGKQSDQPITWTPLFKMSNSWLESVLQYNEERNIQSVYNFYYKEELKYRKQNNIVIED